VECEALGIVDMQEQFELLCKSNLSLRRGEVDEPGGVTKCCEPSLPMRVRQRPPEV
jgi:hypothetical protein